MIRKINLIPSWEKIEKIEEALVRLHLAKASMDPQQYHMEEVCLTDLLSMMKEELEETEVAVAMA
jgi:hypothetical protein